MSETTPALLTRAISEMIDELERAMAPEIRPSAIAAEVHRRHPDVPLAEVVELTRRICRQRYEAPGLSIQELPAGPLPTNPAERARSFRVWANDLVARAGNMSTPEVLAEADAKGLTGGEFLELSRLLAADAERLQAEVAEIERCCEQRSERR